MHVLSFSFLWRIWQLILVLLWLARKHVTFDYTARSVLTEPHLNNTALNKIMSNASSFQERSSDASWKVLVVGGSYAGLAAATNLLDQCEARVARFLLGSAEESDPGPKVPVEITIVDERDGYCEPKRSQTTRVPLTLLRSLDRVSSSFGRYRVCVKGLGQV